MIGSPSDVDSGVECGSGPINNADSLENSPEREVSTMSEHDEKISEIIEEDDEDLDETLSERLWGLTEMFPSWLRSGVWSLTTNSATGMKNLYGFSRSALWILCSSSVILMAPVVFEVERAQMEEMQKMQQRQILLGPSAAVSGGPSHMGMPMPPPMSSAPQQR